MHRDMLLNTRFSGTSVVFVGLSNEIACHGMEAAPHQTAQRQVQQ